MSKNILIVDDSASMRQMVRLTLSGAGYELVEAVDGNDGFTKAQNNKVDLVITDVNMPGRNGYELIRDLRALPAFKGVPIILLTTESDAERKKEAKAAGATGWITKPFQQEQLVAVARKVMGA